MRISSSANYSADTFFNLVPSPRVKVTLELVELEDDRPGFVALEKIVEQTCGTRRDGVIDLAHEQCARDMVVDVYPVQVNTAKGRGRERGGSSILICRCVSIAFDEQPFVPIDYARSGHSDGLRCAAAIVAHGCPGLGSRFQLMRS